MTKSIFTGIAEVQDEDIKSYLGPFFKAFRERIGMTQKELSDETGFTIQTISKIENGHLPSIGAVSLHNLMYFFVSTCNITAADFVDMFVNYCDGATMEELIQ